MSESAQDPGVLDGRRLISMTDKAADNFTERVNQFQKKLD